MTSPSLSNLVPGNYLVTVTDVNGCTATGSYNVTDPMILSINSSVDNLSCYGSDDGNIDISVMGGVLPYSYSWSPYGEHNHHESW